MQGHGQISNAVNSLGYALTPISLGISFIGAYFIEWLISQIFETQIFKTLSRNKHYNVEFIKSKKKIDPQILPKTDYFI